MSYEPQITEAQVINLTTDLTNAGSGANNITLTGTQTPSGQKTWSGNQYFTSGRPWVDAIGAGADPSGAADSVTAIQSAINTAAAIGGGIVYLSTGIFKISTPLTLLSNVELRGAGVGATVISSSSTTADLICSGLKTITVGSHVLPVATFNVVSTYGAPSAGTFTVVSGAGVQTITYTGKTATTFTGCSGGTGTVTAGTAINIASSIVSVRDLQLKTSVTKTAGNAFNYNNCSQLMIDNVEIVDTWNLGNFSACAMGSISRVTVGHGSGATNSGFYFDTSTDIDIDKVIIIGGSLNIINAWFHIEGGCESITLTSCKAACATGTGLGLWVSNVLAIAVSRNINVIDCYFSGGGQGVYTTTTGSVAPGATTIPVVATATFPASGKLADSASPPQSISYTGKTSNSFTGVTGVVNTISSGGSVRGTNTNTQNGITIDACNTLNITNCFITFSLIGIQLNAGAVNSTIDQSHIARCDAQCLYIAGASTQVINTTLSDADQQFPIGSGSRNPYAYVNSAGTHDVKFIGCVFNNIIGLPGTSGIYPNYAIQSDSVGTQAIGCTINPVGILGAFGGTYPVDTITGGVNVKDLYADGLVSGDDTTAFLTAIASFPNGGIIYIPAGTYVISQPLILPSNLRIVGAGDGTTIIKAKDSTFFTAAPLNSTDSYMLVGNAADGVDILDITLDVNQTLRLSSFSSSQLAGGINMISCTNSRIQRVTVLNTVGSTTANSSAIQFVGGSQNRINDCTVNTCGTTTRLSDGLVISTSPGSIISDCLAIVCTGYGVVISNSNRAGVYDSLMLSCHGGVAIQKTDNNSNSYSGCFADGITINTWDTTTGALAINHTIGSGNLSDIICNNISIQHGAGVQVGPAISVSNTGGTGTISNVVLGDLVVDSSTKQGVDINKANNVSISNIQVLGTLGGAGSHGIHIRGGSSGVNVNSSLITQIGSPASASSSCVYVDASTNVSILNNTLTGDSTTGTGITWNGTCTGAEYWGNNITATAAAVSTGSNTFNLFSTGGGIQLQTGANMYSGTGAPTIAGAVGDRYIRTDTDDYYRCTTAGVAGVAVWASVGVKSVTAADSSIVIGGTALAPTIQRAALTGDISAAAGSNATTLVNTGPGATGPIGTATTVPAVTIDAKGRVTVLGSVSIQIAESQVTSLTSDLALKANLASPTFTGTLTTPVIIQTGIRSTPSSTTVLSTDYMIIVSVTGQTITLPSPLNGRHVIVKLIAVGTCTVSGGGNNIDGASTATLTGQYASADYISDGTNWFTV